MVHTYSLLGQNVALDVNSGAVHALDDLSFALLRRTSGRLAPDCPAEIRASLPEYSEAEKDEAWGELFSLQQQGLLYSEDEYKAMSLPEDAPVKALCLHVSHDCNLRCAYCFASTGDFGTGRKIMPFETAKAAVDFAVRGPRHNIEIDFFGGEPLMAFDVVKKTVEYARSLEKEKNKHFRFTITTNGVLLGDDEISYINENMDNVVLSLDGRKEVNDSLRKTPRGQGSYDLVLPKFQKLVAARQNGYYARGTFTRNNLDFAEDALHLAACGFEHLSVEPAVGQDQFSLREEDLQAAFAEYERLAEIMRKRRDFAFFHFNIDLAQGPCVYKRLRGCGAGFEYVAITPDGDIYPCHQFVGREEYRLGNLFDGRFDKALSKKFASMNVYTRQGCADCWAKFYCSGGCSALNVGTNNDLAIPDEIGCKLERKRVECAIALKIARAREA